MHGGRCVVLSILVGDCERGLRGTGLDVSGLIF